MNTVEPYSCIDLNVKCLSNSSSISPHWLLYCSNAVYSIIIIVNDETVSETDELERYLGSGMHDFYYAFINC